MISPGDKGIGIPFYNSGWLPTLILEGKAKYQLKAIKNKDVIYFPSVFSNPRLRGSDLERQCRGVLQICSVLSGCSSPQGDARAAERQPVFEEERAGGR